jgi:hypothetical protein
MSAEHGHPQAHDSHGPPDPPEPKTPMWLPALGAALFLIAGVWFAVTPSAKPAQDAAAPEGAASAAPVATNAPGQPFNPPGGGNAAPGAPGAPGGKEATPEQQAVIERLRQQLQAK